MAVGDLWACPLSALGRGNSNTDGENPDTALGSGGQFVWFGVYDQDRPDPSKDEQRTRVVTEGDRVTFEMAGQRIAVQTDAALREKVLATVHIVDKDQNGCPVVAPFADEQGWRPHGPAVTELGKIKQISACNYGGAKLHSSVRLRGAKAARAIEAMAAAPEGGGPNTPAANCRQPEDLVAQDQIVLLVEAERPGMIGLRWSGCQHRGLDDGTTVRRLTRESVLPFMGGPNRVTGWSGGERMAQILLP